MGFESVIEPNNIEGQIEQETSLIDKIMGEIAEVLALIDKNPEEQEKVEGRLTAWFGKIGISFKGMNSGLLIYSIFLHYGSALVSSYDSKNLEEVFIKLGLASFYSGLAIVASRILDVVQDINNK